VDWGGRCAVRSAVSSAARGKTVRGGLARAQGSSDGACRHVRNLESAAATRDFPQYNEIGGEERR
jgi:hypothetical protein